MEGVVVVLDDQFGHLVTAVLVSGGVLLKDADEGDLSPDGEAQLVTCVVEVLAVLIVGQTDGVGTQLLDEHGILVVILSGQGVALVQTILMASHAAQRVGTPLMEKPSFGVTV